MLWNETNVILTTSQGGAGEYTLVVNNLRDVSPRANLIAPNSSVNIGLDLLIPIDAAWFYNANGTNMPVNWSSKGYQDNDWSIGLGLFYSQNQSLPGPKNTLIPFGTPSSTIQAYYFRKHLPIAVGAPNSLLAIRHIIDDGVIVYANGTEVHRFNMPAGNVAYTTHANTNVNQAVWMPLAGAFASPANIGAGDNVFAAEVHQNSATSLDVCFGLELTITAPSGLLISNDQNARLDIARFSDGGMALTWASPGMSLFKAEKLPASEMDWTVVATGVTSYTVPAGSHRQVFYRLRK